jgi:hypothetical protein
MSALTLLTKKVGNDAFSFRRPCHFQANWLITGFNYNSERQKRATLAFQIDKSAELGQHLRRRLKAIRVPQRQGCHLEGRTTNRIQNRSTALSHFGFSESTKYRWFHGRIVLDFGKLQNCVLTVVGREHALGSWNFSNISLRPRAWL